VKPATVLIFSLLFSAGIAAECKPLAKTTGADTFWRLFSETYGTVRFPDELKVCTGRSYFFEIPGGSKMQSALDRKQGRILRRSAKLTDLMHELAHVYLDLRWKVLPYPVSEPLALAMSDPAQCGAAPAQTGALKDRWQMRANLHRCELLNLLKDVLNSDAEIRNALPLK
jgi:hypothetical protein